METMECEPNRYCSVGGNGLKLYSNGRLLFLVAATNWYITSYAQPGTPDSGEPFTLYLFATESDKIRFTVILCDPPRILRKP
jgi:hypothetical protein